MLKRTFAIVAHHAVFGLFVVLDGSRKIDPAEGANDYFELRQVHGSGSPDDILSGPQGQILHELL